MLAVPEVAPEVDNTIFDFTVQGSPELQVSDGWEQDWNAFPNRAIEQAILGVENSRDV